MDLWDIFTKTGKVEDYLKYRESLKKDKNGKKGTGNNNKVDRL